MSCGAPAWLLLLLLPAAAAAPPTDLSPTETAAALAAIGYGVDRENPAHPTTRSALWSFRRHWCADTLDRPYNSRMAGMLKAVAEAIKKT